MDDSASALAGTRGHQHAVPIRARGMQSDQCEDILGEAVSRLGISEQGQRSRDKSQDGTRGLHYHPIHRTHSLDSIRQQGPQQRWEQEGFDPEEPETTHVPEKEQDQNKEQGEERTEDRSRGEPQACLFVASLAASRTDAQLMESVTEHFKRWGPLLNVKVLKDWMQRPYSFVQFERVEDARRAMVEAHNSVIDGRHIRIEQARVNRTLLILRLGRSTTEQDIIDVLEQYGPLEDVSVFHDLGPARNKRYAFAKFCYRDDAINAFMALRNDTKWTVEWAPNLSKENQIERESVFVGQLNPDLVTEASLRDRFQEYGCIENIHLVKRTKPGTSQSSAFAFIDFDNEQSARNAIEHENNSLFQDTNIRVQYRESGEYRQQRQNVAMQVTRGMTGGPPPVSPLPSLHAPQYGGAYPSYREHGMGRPLCYTSYYPYPPPGIQMVGPSFVPQPRLGPMFAHPSGTPRGPGAAQDTSQAYQGSATFGGQTIQVRR
ncbi:hypothetical protein BGX28_003599 [Mortierella sp. GBA30]|nr:hypothetical protein BGX28_003599 [Mortierella sp. GBA30]